MQADIQGEAPGQPVGVRLVIEAGHCVPDNWVHGIEIAAQGGRFEQVRHQPPVHAVVFEVAQQQEAAEEIERYLPSHPAGEISIRVEQYQAVRRRPGEHDYPPIEQHADSEAIPVSGAHLDQEGGRVRKQRTRVAETPVALGAAEVIEVDVRLPGEAVRSHLNDRYEGH